MQVFIQPVAFGPESSHWTVVGVDSLCILAIFIVITVSLHFIVTLIPLHTVLCSSLLPAFILLGFIKLALILLTLIMLSMLNLSRETGFKFVPASAPFAIAARGISYCSIMLVKLIIQRAHFHSTNEDMSWRQQQRQYSPGEQVACS